MLGDESIFANLLVYPGRLAADAALFALGLLLGTVLVRGQYRRQLADQAARYETVMARHQRRRFEVEQTQANLNDELDRRRRRSKIAY